MKKVKGNPDKKIKYPAPTKYKKEYEFFKEVNSLIFVNIQINLDKAYKNFFKDKFAAEGLKVRRTAQR